MKMGSFVYNDEEHHDRYKIVLTGDSGVGKSNIISHFLKNKFNIDSKPTIGIEFGTRNIRVGGKIIRGCIFDTGGGERYRAQRAAFYREALGALIVYDITRKVTFENVKKWLKELREYTDQTIVVMLIGNKTDLAHLRVVPMDEAKTFSKKENILFMETSAAALHSLDNIEEAFTCLVSQINLIQDRLEHGLANKPPSTTKIPMASVGGNDDHELVQEKLENTDLVAGSANDPQICKACDEVSKKSHFCFEELSDLKEKLEMLQTNNVEMLARETLREAELELLRTSVDQLQKNMEKMLAQQPSQATRPSVDDGKIVFNFNYKK